MSGVGEAMGIIGLISSIINIIKESKAVYDTVKDAEGLPKAFQEVTPKLVIVNEILALARQWLAAGTNDETGEAIRKVLLGIEDKAKKLREIFQKVVPGGQESRVIRYWKAARAVGKGGRVEDLMADILKGLDLMGTYLNFEEKTKKKIQAAIKQVEDIDPSLPEGFEEKGTGAYTYIGSGPMNVNSGDGEQTNNNNTGKGNFFVGGSFGALPSNNA